jgi:hypothetical protein
MFNSVWHLHLKLKKQFSSDKEVISEVLKNYVGIFQDLSIDGSWHRDGDFIVAGITIEDETFFAQGRTPDELVEMVNDSILAFFEVPSQYFAPLKEKGSFTLQASEMNKLHDSSVQGSDFKIKARKLVGA